MVVVSLLAILALIATAAYRRWVHTAYLSEAHEMVTNIRAAQESFRAENGGYLNISTQLGPSYDYPANPPGKFKTQWGGDCAGCPNPRNWSLLNIQPSGPLAFGYSVVANPSSDPSSNYNITVNGQSLAIVNGMPAPWYVIEADGDLDGNSVFTHVYGMSATNQIFVDNEGE
jgi:type II secretory pathway pseudopilin PulG